MLISDRSKEIIENLMNANGPLTVSALSKKLGVTERTIYRQIPEVTEIIESSCLYELRRQICILRKGASAFL